MTGDGDFDVIVVGARCAGATTAMLLGRAGLRVLLLERSTFPADTLSTLYIQQPGVALLAQWGLLDRVKDSGCPRLDRVTYRLGEVVVSGCAGPIDGIREAYAPRRLILDRILVEAATDSGVEFRDGCTVTAVDTVDGRVVGVRYREGRREYHATARLIVGADGMRSTVAELVGAKTVIENDRLTCAYYSYWEGVDAHFELYEGDSGWVSTVPTNDAVLVSAYFPQDRFDEVRRDAQPAYLANIEANAPRVARRLVDATRVERLYGTGDQRNFFRQATGPGWVLIGDAGHHKDSLTARGIGDAFQQARMLAERVAEVVDDRVALDDGLARYAAEREPTFMESYQSTLLVAQSSARRKRKMMLAAVGSSLELTQRYFDTVAGILPVSQLYTPELQQRLADAMRSSTPVER
ncbi:2-polyprenyl-6-methoxyphenol hydroxylase-like FAD-dependent oxidoreductase [Stackebrandtia endophytica]|uniref:2-polyprenyl-6-methoxyphenol hydroxylase-like FAD-dependent oxidoreductase n=1 Tax=Stackebrandtia endophytica TaxID=1496996 RepID=A0A543AS39_9ACTN|nr:NAD(P)/FAD-dependent oxidoreductase [Stackebrandtia endophytica]TQL75325.1 2-polyprenyl-6-methoxyphenol hydroxylase-like FAD-dependent oxidoreductase [Stackebrandtia endophytica]